MIHACKIIILLLLVELCAFHFCIAQTAPTIEWQNTIGGNSYDQLSSIQQTSDGGYIMGGFSTSTISGDKTEDIIGWDDRSEEHTSELQSQSNLVCRLLLEKKNKSSSHRATR